MVNVILELQEEHLRCDKALTREYLDTSEINAFFRQESNLHDQKLNENLLLNRCPLNSMFKEFTFSHFTKWTKGCFVQNTTKFEGL